MGNFNSRYPGKSGDVTDSLSPNDVPRKKTSSGGSQREKEKNVKKHPKKRPPKHRVPTCKERERCAALRRVTREGRATVADLDHLSAFSHARRLCERGSSCVHFQGIMRGSYDVEDLCHHAVCIHPGSRFVTAFDPPPDEGKGAPEDEKKARMRQAASSSLQVPRGGGKDGMETYRKVGIMACDGTCGSPITRGLWKCWSFRDLIWNYKYRRYRKSKDPYHTHRKADGSGIKYGGGGGKDEDELEKKDVSKAFVTMVESVIALAGESFLVEMHLLMSHRPASSSMASTAFEDHSSDSEEDSAGGLYARGRSSAAGGGAQLGDAAQAAKVASQYHKAFGPLLRRFSNVARREFGFPDSEYPVIRKGKAWQNPLIFGVLLGIVNSRLTISLEAFSRKSRPAPGQKRTVRPNLRQEIFIKGCRNATRTLFKEVRINNFEQVLTLPRFKNVDLCEGKLSQLNPNSYSYVSADFLSLQDVATEKLKHPRHLAMGSCLEEEELLAILLLTGTSVGNNLLKSHRRQRDYCKWRVLQMNLMSALAKLNKHDKRPLPNHFFHGLKRSSRKMKMKSNDLYLFNTFVSTTIDHRLIESQFRSNKEGALLFLDRREPIVCADISWISKFYFEHEVLFAPCALNIPSPFVDKEDSASDRRRKSRQRGRSRRGRSRAQRSVGKQDDEEVKEKPKEKGKGKEKNGRAREKSAAVKVTRNQRHLKDRCESLADLSLSRSGQRAGTMKLSLVDGRLAGMNASTFRLHKDSAGRDAAASVISVSGVDDSPVAPSEEVKEEKAQHDIDLNLVADFLYGKTTAELLWSHLDWANEGRIEAERVQQLFLSLFLFAVRMEMSGTNVGVYLPQCQALAEEYTQRFTAAVSGEGGGRVTREQFLQHAVELHDMYDQFLNDIALPSEQPAVGDNLKSETVLRGSLNSLPDLEESESPDHSTLMSAKAVLVKAGGKKQSLSSKGMVKANVGVVATYCRSEEPLQSVWEHFTEEMGAAFMNYGQFDVLVYAALAFFVQQRNPDAELATRESLRALIDQLRVSLLAAYDPAERGYVTRDAFEQFGEYLQSEYAKLRQSIQHGDPSHSLQSDYGESVGDSVDDQDDSETWEDDGDEEDEDEDDEEDDLTDRTQTDGGEDEEDDEDDDEDGIEADDEAIVAYLEEMKVECNTCLEILSSNVQQFEAGAEGRISIRVDEFYTVLRQQVDDVASLTKEMEIQCNNLENDEMRYHYAQEVNQLDMLREQLQAQVVEIMQGMNN